MAATHVLTRPDNRLLARRFAQKVRIGAASSRNLENNQACYSQIIATRAVRGSSSAAPAITAVISIA
jgi:hypothetical protein